MSEIDFSPDCALSRKEYWEEFYSKELENFEEYGDTGDIWFGKKNVDRITKWMLENSDKLSSVLDIGCGNGMTLISLAKQGFKNLTGIDYASEAVQLAQNITKHNDFCIKYEVTDFLQVTVPNSDSVLNKTYQVIIDKGTYDAICLCPENGKEKRERYKMQVSKLLNSDGYFILFSCNWTKEELCLHFSEFIPHDEIETSSIGFGGKTGQTVTALILKKSS